MYGEIKQNKNKIIHIFALNWSNFDIKVCKSNTCTVEYPYKSGIKIEIPENDDYSWKTIEELSENCINGQIYFFKKIKDFFNFSLIIDFLSEKNNYINSLITFGIDLSNTSINQNFEKICKMYIEYIYDYQGYQWFEWYVYEKMRNNSLVAHDINGNEICYNIKSLWEYLEKNHKKND